MILEQLRPKNGAGIFGSVREETVFLNVSPENQVLSKTFPAVKHRTPISYSLLSFLNIYLKIF